MTLRQNWPVALTLLTLVQTIGFAGAAARDLSHGALSWSMAIAWQGLIYAAWLPFAGLMLWLARRLGLTLKWLMAAYPVIAVSTFLHAGLSVGLAQVFAASPLSFSGWLYRLPVDVLIATAITATVAAVRAYRLAQDETRRAARLQATLDAARDRPAAAEMLLVSCGRSRVSVGIDEVEWFAAAGNYAVVNWGSRDGLVRETLTSLAERLDPAVFIRAHRSTVVNLRRVQAITTLKDGGWVLTMASGTGLSVSRGYRDAVLARLGRA